jgi:hypothetical protein
MAASLCSAEARRKSQPAGLRGRRAASISDHGLQFAALETRMEDLRSMLDAAGASNASSS